MSSTAYTCLTAIQTAIQNLDLTGILDASVVIAKLPLKRFLENATIAFPAVLLTPEKETLAAANTDADDIGYGVSVAIIYADNQERTGTGNLDAILQARQSIIAEFRNQRIPGVTSSWTCRIEPGPVVSVPAYAENLLVSAFTIRVMCRQSRS